MQVIQFILAGQMASVVNNLNALFCDGEPNEEWLEPIVQKIAKQTSVFSLEGTIHVLERALAIARKVQ